jgi:hypothetical protein
MLQAVLKVLKDADEPVSLQTLSQRLSIEKSALNGMLELLVRKGKLDIKHASADNNPDQCEDIQCLGCIKAKACPFIAKMPVMYALKEKDPTG